MYLLFLSCPDLEVRQNYLPFFLNSTLFSLLMFCFSRSVSAFRIHWKLNQVNKREIYIYWCSILGECGHTFCGHTFLIYKEMTIYNMLLNGSIYILHAFIISLWWWFLHRFHFSFFWHLLLYMIIFAFFLWVILYKSRSNLSYYFILIPSKIPWVRSPNFC